MIFIAVMAGIVLIIRSTRSTPVSGNTGPQAPTQTPNRQPMNADRTAIRQYLDCIGRIPMMTPSEEIEMGRLVKRARELRSQDKPLTPAEKREVKRGERARQRFVEANMRLVVYIAKKAQSKIKSLEMVDLMQEGAVGLMRAAELFDPERGYKFSTYSYWWIKQAIGRLIGTGDRLIRRPTTVADLAMRLPLVVQNLSTELGRMPTKEEIAVAAKTKVAELDTLAERGNSVMSLDYRLEDGVELSELIADPASFDTDSLDLALDDSLTWEHVKSRLEKLDEKDQLCITLRYGLDGGRVHSLQEVGEHPDICLSKERVRQRIAMALRRIKVELRHLGDSVDNRVASTSVVATTEPAYLGPALTAVYPRSKSRQSQAQQSALSLSA